MNKLAFFSIALFITTMSVAQLTEKHSIYFDVDKDTFAPEEGMELNALFEKLLYKPILDVRIYGYCDDRGTQDYNLELSNRRVESVSKWLQDHDITLDHISTTVEGKGEVALEGNTGNEVSEERARNRRVDVVFNLKETYANRLVIKKLNKDYLTDEEERVIKDYEEKVVKQITESKEKPTVIAVEDLLEIPTNLDIAFDNSEDPFKSLLNKNLKKGTIIRLENLLFHKGRSSMVPESVLLMDRVAEILVARKDIKFEIRGHVCCINARFKDAYNRDTRQSTLSKDRAKFIYDLLIEQGINKDRMTHKGYGRSMPLGGLDKMDRRVELYITDIDPSK